MSSAGFFTPTAAILAVLTLVACQAPVADAPTVERRPTAVASVIVTPTPSPQLAVAVPVGSPTATPALVGDFSTLMRPRLAALRGDFMRIEQQLAVAQQAPLRMADDDWRNQMASILEAILTDSAAVRTLTTRLTPPAPIGPAATKLADDADFVANEFRMALDYDPDGTHFIRAARAERTTLQELDDLASQLH